MSPFEKKNAYDQIESNPNKKLNKTPDKKLRAVSMTRLDQLAQPTRRKGEHLRAVIERERQQQIEAMTKSNLALDKTPSSSRSMSRSMTHLSSTGSTYKLNLRSTLSKSAPRPLRKTNTTKSMSQLVTAKLLSISGRPSSSPSSSTTSKFNNSINSKNNSKNNSKQIIEIDSRTTNVSVAGVFCFYFVNHFFLFYLVLLLL